MEMRQNPRHLSKIHTLKPNRLEAETLSELHFPDVKMSQRSPPGFINTPEPPGAEHGRGWRLLQ